MYSFGKNVVHLNLEGILSNQYTSNYYDFQIANSQVENYQSQFWLSLLNNTPNFSVNYSKNQTPSPSIFQSNQNLTQTTNQSAVVTLTQPVSGIVKNIFRSLEMNENQNLATTNLESKKIEILSTVAKAYLKATSDSKTCDIYKTKFEIAKKQYEDTEKLFQSGEENKTKIDVLKTLSNEKKSEQESLQCLTDLKNDRMELKKYLQLSEDDDIEFDEMKVSLFQTHQLKLPELKYFLQKIEKSPTVDAYFFQTQILKEQARQNVMSYLPQVNFVSNYTYTPDNLVMNSDGTQGKVDTKLFSFGIALNWSILDSGTFLQNKTQLSHQKEEMNLNYEKAIKNATLTVQQSYETFQNQLNLAPFYEENVKILKEAFEKSSIQYRLGLISATELTLAQNDYVQSQIEWIQSHIKIDGSWIDLLSAAGIEPTFQELKS